MIRRPLFDLRWLFDTELNAFVEPARTASCQKRISRAPLTAMGSTA